MRHAVVAMLHRRVLEEKFLTLRDMVSNNEDADAIGRKNGCWVACSQRPR
jgi:hypothetical protein